jgi:hypothetical protein
MSKDTKLCNEMDKIFNQTKRVSGNFLSNKYSIAWQNVLGAHWARFDVENDGADELVFKVSSNLNGMSSENLFILPPNSDLLSKFNLLESSGNTSIPKELLDTTNKFDPQEYYLKELPQSFKKAMIDDARKQLPNSIRDKINADYRPVIAGSFVLDPFDFENTIYISLTDLLSNWIVVGKYNQPDEIEDFCYFYNPDTKYH